jgi:hypothetical protein
VEASIKEIPASMDDTLFFGSHFGMAKPKIAAVSSVRVKFRKSKGANP